MPTSAPMLSPLLLHALEGEIVLDEEELVVLIASVELTLVVEMVEMVVRLWLRSVTLKNAVAAEAFVSPSQFRLNTNILENEKVFLSINSPVNFVQGSLAL
jgi:hypothetical protein